MRPTAEFSGDRRNTRIRPESKSLAAGDAESLSDPSTKTARSKSLMVG